MKIEKGELRIDLDEIISRMTEDQLRELAQTAVFQESVLNGICDALVDGIMFDDWWWGGDTFNDLRLKLKPLMDDIAAQAVSFMKQELDKARHERDKWRSACWTLERHWHDAKLPDEQRIDYYAPRVTKEQAKVYIEKIAAELGEKL